MKLPYNVLEPLFNRLRTEQILEVRGASSASTATFRYALTDKGRARAQAYLDINQYTGAAPVPLTAYVAMIKALQAARGYLDRERMRRGFSHLIVNDDMIEKLGPAANANKALFLYGAPGNGKTVLADGLSRTIGGDMYIPYAVEIDGQIITMFDPINHVRLDSDEQDQSSVIAALDARDRRWVRIKRPVVMVGGELTLDQLDLKFNPLSKFYEAPLQLRANGGVFLVDDFGRQRVAPSELLNRWIVPLESRVDFLTLHTGKKFEVPFDVLTVFATNLDPLSLADEAFLRRIPYKIPVGDPSPENFDRIFELNCRQRGLTYNPNIVSYLRREHYEPADRPFRACHARDLLDQVVALCRFQGIAPTINRELLDAACQAYFVDNALSASRHAGRSPEYADAR
jgi:predicted ATPase with chaperone activity